MTAMFLHLQWWCNTSYNYTHTHAHTLPFYLNPAEELQCTSNYSRIDSCFCTDEGRWPFLQHQKMAFRFQSHELLASAVPFVPAV